MSIQNTGAQGLDNILQGRFYLSTLTSLFHLSDHVVASACGLACFPVDNEG
jgi:hypothetical protein